MLGLNQSIPSIAFTFTPLITAYLLTKMGWRSTLGILSIPALTLSLYILFFVKGSSDVEGTTRDALNLTKLKEQLKNRAVIPSLATTLRRAGFLAELGKQQLEIGNYDNPATLQPIYLRRPPITKPKHR